MFRLENDFPHDFAFFFMHAIINDQNDVVVVASLQMPVQLIMVVDWITGMVMMPRLLESDDNSNGRALTEEIDLHRTRTRETEISGDFVVEMFHVRMRI